MANHVFYMFLILAMAGHSSATWCVCKDGNDVVLQKTLDYACGAGADCNPIHQTGSCFNPNTVRAHCSYAVNSYFQKKGQASGTCDFAGTATIVTSDPSISGCSYPASASASTSNTGMPTNGKPSTTTSGNNTPLITTPSSGGILGGGINNGIGANGSGLNTDYTGGGKNLSQKISLFSSSCMIIVVSALILW
ncbi:hypothetical protein Leryth_014280 [Lithospermum erythrorhizon]|nr:hypothetical protein Leryth_014280 [Lithospermum erythrorhizon]